MPYKINIQQYSLVTLVTLVWFLPSMSPNIHVNEMFFSSLCLFIYCERLVTLSKLVRGCHQCVFLYVYQVYPSEKKPYHIDYIGMVFHQCVSLDVNQGDLLVQRTCHIHYIGMVSQQNVSLDGNQV